MSARAATGISMAVSTEAEVERLSFGHLMQAGRDYAASAWAMVRSDSGNNGGTPLAGISGQSTQLANDGEPEEGSPAHLKVSFRCFIAHVRDRAYQHVLKTLEDLSCEGRPDCLHSFL